MKIKNLSCTQFAGVRDRTISFSDGINVVYGKNESGKSTMANLIARTLFQKANWIDGAIENSVTSISPVLAKAAI